MDKGKNKKLQQAIQDAMVAVNAADSKALEYKYDISDQLKQAYATLQSALDSVRTDERAG